MESCLTVLRIPRWCATCHNLDVECPFPGGKSVYVKDVDFNLPALALSASAGCNICAGVCLAIGHYVRKHNDGNWPSKPRLWIELYEGSCPRILPIIKGLLSLLFQSMSAPDITSVGQSYLQTCSFAHRSWGQTLTSASKAAN